jgi:hypothetical protein
MESTASEIYHALSRPWGKGEVKERKGPGGKMLSYVDARQVQNRLDEVVGTENWQTHFSEVCGNYCCTLSLKIDGEWVAKSDGAGETSIEGDKGGFSDAFKRAAVSFGIARYLYSDSKMTPEQFDKRRGVMADVQSEDKATIPTDEDKMVANDLVLAVQNENSQKILEIWASLITDQERTVATWSLLQSQTRRYINKLVKESNQ